MGEGLVSTAPTVGLGDAMIMCHRNMDNMSGLYNNPFFLLVFLAMFGGGFGGFGGWGNAWNRDGANLNTAAIEGAKADIQSSIYASNDQQTLMEMIRGINYGLADVGYALNNAVKDAGYANTTAIKDSSYATQAALNNGFNGVNANIVAGISTVKDNLVNGFDKVYMGLSENRFAGERNTNAIERDLCATNHNIDNLRYDNERNTGRIENAIHAEGQATRALIAQNTVQDLRDKLAATSQELQNARFEISQGHQNNVLIAALKNNGCGCGVCA